MNEPAPERLEVIRAVVAAREPPAPEEEPEGFDWQEVEALFSWQGWIIEEEKP